MLPLFIKSDLPLIKGKCQQRRQNLSARSVDGEI